MESTQQNRRAARQRLFWRLHFWAGLIGAPIVLFAAFTGLLYVFTPQIEAWCHADLDRVAVGAQRQALDAQVAGVLAAHSHQALRFVVPAHGATDSTQVYLTAPHAGHRGGGEHGHGLPDGSIAYVDPYTGTTLGTLPEMQRFKTWAKKLHSSALQGDGWRWLLELGASWMLLLFATGLVLWWPAGGATWRALLPRLGRGRASWRDLHATVAIALGLVLAVVLVTGLTWAEHSGERFRAAQETLGQGAPKPPKPLRSIAPPGAAPLGWQAVYERVRRDAPDIALQITPPAGADGVWHIENFDRTQPTRRFARVLDAYSGTVLFASGWAQLPLLSQATAVGIPFHRGEFGLWNQVLLALAALAAVFSVVSGLAMWWLRRPRGRLAAPRLSVRDLRDAPRWLWPLAAVLGWALPVFGWSLLLLSAVEGARLALGARR